MQLTSGESHFVVVGLGDNVAPQDIEENMRVGLMMGYSKYTIQLPLPTQIVLGLAHFFTDYWFVAVPSMVPRPT